ncbi:MAG: Smr/MutS family protein [Desulfohalobiaceae bacterium]
MQARTLRLLEYERVLDHLGQKTLSEAGRRHCLQLGPLIDPEHLRQESELARQALQESELLLGSLQEYPDLEGLLDHLVRGRGLDEDGLWAVRRTLEVAGSSRQSLGKRAIGDYPALEEFLRSCPWPEKSWQALQRCLDPSGEIKDSSSPELQEIRGQVRSIQKQCRSRLEEYLQQKSALPFLQDDYLTISADRYVLALKSNFKGRLSGIVHDYSQSGETCYFEPLELVELNNRLQELKYQEQEAKRRVLRYLTSILLQEGEALQGTYAWLVELDVLRAKVALAADCQGRILELGGQLDLRGVRHPLLALEQGFVQEVDICLQEGQKALLVSGGNAGGKTVCLKTLGLSLLMTLSALPVPAREGSSLPFCRQVHVFLGDEQNLQQSLSTFTAQIEHFRQAWKELDQETLVLLDEFGAGTDPSQGAALAQAVLEAVLDRGSWLAVATHFPALKVYALNDSRIRPASVLFDPQTRQPLYRLAYDQVGASQALEVAREQGLPEEILQRAQEYLLLQGEDTTKLLERLNQLAVQRQQELQELEQERIRLAEEEKKLRRELEQKKQQLVQEVSSKAREIVSRWQQEKIGRKQALRDLGRLKSRLQEGREGSQDPAATQNIWSSLQEGLGVYCPAWGRNGRVLELDAKKKRVKVDLGGVNLWLRPQELSLASEAQKLQSEQPRQVQARQESGLHLDLRGKRSEEAEAELTRFLDQALLQGRQELEVIHGKGTGALRQVVHDLASSFPGVQGIDLAPEDRGGDGVTIIRLG